jgi:hypothetical protein
MLKAGDNGPGLLIGQHAWFTRCKRNLKPVFGRPITCDRGILTPAP